MARSRMTAKTAMSAFSVAVLVIVCGSASLQGEDHYPGASYPRLFWRSESIGSTIQPSNTERSPIELFDLPHQIGEEDRPVLGIAGGVLREGAGRGAAVAGVLPNLYASVGAGLAFLGDDDGVLLRGDVAVARPIGPRTTAGASITGQFARGDGDDVGVGVSAGISHRVGSLGGLSRFRVHGGMRNVGKTVRRVDDEVPVFPAFSPFIGFDALPIVSSDVSIGISSTMTIDRFQGISFDAMGVVRFANGITASVGWWHRVGSGESGVWPGIGASVHIPLGGEDPRYRGHVSVQPVRGGSAAIAGGVVAAFEKIDVVAPTVEVSTENGSEGLTMLSPRAERRQVIFRISARDDRHIARIEASLVDSKGTPIRSWDFTPRYAATVAEKLADRITRPLYPTSMTAMLVFDLQSVEDDGFYHIDIVVFDAAGNWSPRISREFLVDTEPPEIKERSLGVVSENGGVVPSRRPRTLSENNTMTYLFAVREADAIEAEIVDAADRSVARPELTLSNELDDDGFYTGTVEWSGVYENGKRAEEGAYRVQVTAYDEIGNRNVIQSERIVVEQTIPTYRMDLSNTTIAETGDDDSDEITVRPKIDPIVGLKEWVLGIQPIGSNTPIRMWSGIDLPPESIVLEASLFPDDGVYEIMGESRYQNGSGARTPTRRIIVDRIAPSIEIAVSPQRVQPENGREVTIYVESDGTATAGRLVARKKSLSTTAPVEVRSFDRVPERASWSFVDDQGELIEPGIYQLSFEVTDAYGNPSRSNPVDVLLLERLSGVGIVAVENAFSPNGDGVKDTIRFSVDGPSRQEGDFALEIVDPDGTVVRTIRGEATFPRTIEWDGRRGDGRIAFDGLYRGRVAVDYSEVEPIVAETASFRVDTEAPGAAVSIQGERIVSPDGDGRKDELSIVLTGIDDDPSGGRIVDVGLRGQRDTGLTIDVAYPVDPSRRFLWSPRRLDGSTVPDGEYVIAVTVADSVGNARTVMSESFLVDTRPVRAYLRIDRGAINPSLGDQRNAVAFSPVVSDPSRIYQWEFRIVEKSTDRSVLRSGGGEDNLPEFVRWPGRSDRGDSAIADGEYFAELRVEYLHGPVFECRSPVVVVDSTAPIIDVETRPSPFSPDGDGIADVLQFEIDYSDPTPLLYWYLEITDPKGAFFYDVGGEGSPPTVLAWDGTARNGEIVVSAEIYPWRLEVSDRLGNVATASGSLPIDILVEPFKGGYRMQVPSITFPPNSSELILEGPEPGAIKNREVLDRVSEILKRYPAYNIIVEGHAVNVTGTEREERAELLPLSTARAEAVRNALIRLGVSRGMVSAEGRGGTVPVVDHTDTTMRWKNRRVDFVLQRAR